MYLECDFHSEESWKHQVMKHNPTHNLLTFHSPVGKISSDENLFPPTVSRKKLHNQNSKQLRNSSLGN